MAQQVAKWRCTVDDYHRMAQAGVFRPGQRVELIDGEVFEMSPIGLQHAACVKWLNHCFSAALGTRSILGVQDPLQLGHGSEPQPDVALLRPRADFYRNGHPGAEDTLLAIEVSDTAYEFDHDSKLPLYARQGIVESWLVDIGGEAIEVHRRPGPNGYEDVRRFARGQSVSPLSFPSVSVSVDDVLGPR